MALFVFMIVLILKNESGFLYDDFYAVPSSQSPSPSLLLEPSEVSSSKNRKKEEEEETTMSPV